MINDWLIFDTIQPGNMDNEISMTQKYRAAISSSQTTLIIIMIFRSDNIKGILYIILFLDCSSACELWQHFSQNQLQHGSQEGSVCVWHSKVRGSDICKSQNNNRQKTLYTSNASLPLQNSDFFSIFLKLKVEKENFLPIPCSKLYIYVMYIGSRRSQFDF